MPYRSNKTGASYAVPSWLPAALGDDLQTLAAPRAMTVGAVVQEILHLGLAKERLQEQRFGHIAPASSQLTPLARQLSIQHAMRFGPDEPIAALLCAIVRTWLTVHAPERTRTRPGSDKSLPGAGARESAIVPTKTTARHQKGRR